MTTFGVGVWLLSRVHTMNGVCGPHASSISGGGISANCMNMVSGYFLGFALTVLGLVAVTIALLTLARRDRYERRTVARPAVTTLRRPDPDSLRDVA